MTPSLSALIIAKNEEQDLPGCLESLKGVASEIVVLIDESTSDRTEEIARAHGCKTARRKFDDYAGQRQAALALCTQDWVLWIDADERLSPLLREELPHLLAKPAAAFRIAFEVHFLGRALRFGGLGGETHVRLFQRACAHFIGGALHEGLAVEGATAPPPLGKMIHRPYRDLPDYLAKLDAYTTLGAAKKFGTGARFRPWHHLIFQAELIRRLVLRLAILDGFPGVVWAYLAAFHHWLKYVKLEEMEREKR